MAVRCSNAGYATKKVRNEEEMSSVATRQDLTPTLNHPLPGETRPPCLVKVNSSFSSHSLSPFLSVSVLFLFFLLLSLSRYMIPPTSSPSLPWWSLSVFFLLIPHWPASLSVLVRRMTCWIHLPVNRQQRNTPTALHPLSFPACTASLPHPSLM